MWFSWIMKTFISLCHLLKCVTWMGMRTSNVDKEESDDRNETRVVESRRDGNTMAICSRMVLIPPASKWLGKIQHCRSSGTHVCRRQYLKMEGKRTGKGIPRYELKYLYVCKSGGNSTHSLQSQTCVFCMVDCGLLDLMGHICSTEEKLMRA